MSVAPEPKRRKTIESDLETDYYLPEIEDCVSRVLDALSSETPNHDLLRTTDCHGRLPHHLLFSCLMDESDLSDTQDYMKAFNACYEHFPEGGYTKDKHGFVPLDYFVSGMMDRDGEGVTCMVDELMDDPLDEDGLLNAAKTAIQANPEAIISSGLLEMVASQWDPDKCKDDDDERQLFLERQTKVIEALLDLTFVDTAATDQEEGRRNPLHMIATLSWMKHVEKVLLRFLSPESAQAVDPTNQQLALHMAVSSCGVESQGYRRGYSDLAEEAQIKLEDENRLTVDIGVVERLVDSFPAALGRKDGSGRVPFVLACHNQCSVAVLFHLLRAKPDELAHFR